MINPLVQIIRWPVLQAIFRSRAFRLCYRFVLKPLLWTLLLWLVFPLERINWGTSTSMGVSIFLTVNLLLNSRVGRSLEEMATDWLVQTWQRYGIRSSVAPDGASAVFTLILRRKPHLSVTVGHGA